MSSWNRVHRPTKVSDLHLDSVRDQLTSFLQSGSIPQVLLFAGPKGTGKTSASRIIGSILNDEQNKAQIIKSFGATKQVEGVGKTTPEPLAQVHTMTPLQERILAGNSFIVQEIDAASNRGIDDIRNLKERVLLPPQEGAIALYILDEAHMLTTEAFNALLKLLEEPPSHAAFILATTELHKIPATVVSRCHVIHFQKASQSELLRALKRVLEAEQKSYEPEALELIASRADGSFRDAIKMVELMAQTGSISQERALSLSLGSYQTEIEDLISALIAKDAAAIAAQFEELRSLNVDPAFFYKTLLEYLHTTLLQNLALKEGKPAFEQTVAEFLLREFSQIASVTNTPIPHLPLELKMLEIVSRAHKGPKNNNPAPTQKPQDKKSKASSQSNMAATEDIVPSSSGTPSFPTLDKSQKSGDGRMLCERWAEFINLVANKNLTIAALLRSAKPLDGKIGEIIIGVYYTFHQEQLMQPKIYNMVAQCAADLAGGNLNFNFVLNRHSDSSAIPASESQTLSAVVTDLLM